MLSTELNITLSVSCAEGGAPCAQFHFPDTDTIKAALRARALLLTAVDMHSAPLIIY